MEYLSKSLDETRKIAYGFASGLKGGVEAATVIGLYGELGSGKTTFMKYLAESLGVKETIQSPTFVIMKIYGLEAADGLKKLIHIDAYRIEDAKELLVLGWENIVSDPQNIICIEWPEKISGILPEHTKIYFEHVSEKERNIKMGKGKPRA
jgi:tRNA threonylcarbamoyladenosine biosynthesis protein TsaE